MPTFSRTAVEIKCRVEFEANLNDVVIEEIRELGDDKSPRNWHIGEPLRLNTKKVLSDAENNIIALINDRHLKQKLIESRNAGGLIRYFLILA